MEDFNLNNENYSVGHPTLSEDGKTLYYVSDMPGGYGGKDIYRATLQPDNCWGKAENLGAEVNSSGDELFPYIHNDGTLYFSSNMHNNLGGLDVFSTHEIKGNSWSEPENLNYPLNSSEDDFGFSINSDHKTGFVSSSRASSDKIYSFVMMPPTFNLYGLVREKGTGKPLEGVGIELKNKSTGEKIIAYSDHHGSFKEKLKPESTLSIACKIVGCFSETDSLSTIGKKYSEDFFALFEVEPIILEKPVVLENIYFDFDKWNIRPDAALELDKLVELLNERMELEIEMGSHADVRGSDEYNQKLSEKRAKSTVDYLILKGIDQARLTYKGYGEKVLVNECKNGVYCSEAEHQKNRRTEFKVIKIRK
jgi:outer membrane protein OmpA-like peptidoglycan-associated protein